MCSKTIKRCSLPCSCEYLLVILWVKCVFVFCFCFFLQYDLNILCKICLMNDTDAFFTSVGDIHNLHSKLEVFWGLLVVDLVSKPVELYSCNAQIRCLDFETWIRWSMSPTTRLASFSSALRKPILLF